MPLYEYHCTVCMTTFEALAAVSDARRSRPCPRCRRRAPRVTSAFAIARHVESPAPSASAAKPERPLCTRYPHLPLLCHMDRKSAERFVANVHGRGAEYDDRVGAREELAKKRGERPVAEPAPAAHTHGHSHGGKHSHSHPHRHARHGH